MPIRGKDFNMYMVQDGNPVLICHARDCIITIDTETIETSGPTSRSRTYEYGYDGYTIELDGVTEYTDPANLVQLQEMQLSRTKLNWMAGTDVPGGLVYSGRALINNTSQSSQFRDVLAWTSSLIGDGPLVIQKLPKIKEVYLANQEGIRLPGCPNPYPVIVFWYDMTVIGVANNAGDVMTLFNNYVGNEYFELIGTTTGCDFTMQIDWDAPFEPDFVIAETGPGFVMGRTGNVGDNDVLGETGNVGDNNVLGPFETA